MSAALADLKLAMLGPTATAVSVEQAAALLGCGRTQIFGFLKDGKLRRAKKLGRKVMVRMTSVSALMQSLSEDGTPQWPSSRRSARATTTSRAIRSLPLSGTR
jgi:excisionase family DNA binding protein